MQKRALDTRKRIIKGVIRALIRDGMAGVTYRAVAQAAGVSLAATTRHFSTKQQMIAEASGEVLRDYLWGLERLSDRIIAGARPRLLRLKSDDACTA